MCIGPLSGETAFDAPSVAFDVRPSWRDEFLRDLRARDWLQFRVRTDEGWGELALTLSSPDSAAIPAWEAACCGFAPAAPRWAQPAEGLPALPPHPSPPVIPGLRPVTPVASAATPAPRALPVRALLERRPGDGAPTPEAGRVTWTPLLASDRVEGPPAAALLADVDLPAAGLKVWLDVRPSAPGVLGRLTLSVHSAAVDGAAFGAPASLSALYAYGERGNLLLLPDLVQSLSTPGDYRILVDVPSTGPIAGAIQLAFTDASRRRLTAAVPFDGAVAGILQAASRWQPPGTR